jgi:hypothetical protein
MSVPASQGQYSYAEIFAKKNRALLYEFNVPNGTGGNVNVQTYSALRLNVTDSQSNTVISLTTNANALTTTNANYVQINANATEMNVSANYYTFELNGLSTLGWEALTVGRFRVDA